MNEYLAQNQKLLSAPGLRGPHTAQPETWIHLSLPCINSDSGSQGKNLAPDHTFQLH